MKKSSYLQTLYLQKPWLLIILLALIVTMPWIGLGDFYTKGEPREAALAISMLEGGNWIIPYGFADEFAYKPPLNHWIIAGISYLFNNGEVTPFTSRLPSVLGHAGLIGVCFMFYARRRSTLEAFVTCLILITSFEIHRAAMTTRLDMLLAFFMVTGIFQLFVWKEKRGIKHLVFACIFLSLATLVKGPIGVVLPCAIFSIYLILQRENIFKIAGKVLLITIPSLIVPAIWYVLAYQIKGEDFLNLVVAENFGRFLSINNNALDINYNLGHENPWYFYPKILTVGFLPITILMVISLFFLRFKTVKSSSEFTISNLWNKLLGNKVLLYSFLVVAITLIFYTIPSSKRSVYILPLYPFLSLFIAQYALYLVQHRPKSIRLYTLVLLVVISAVSLFALLALTHIIDVNSLGYMLSERDRTLYDISLISNALSQPTLPGVLVFSILLYTIVHASYLLIKQSNIKVLMASFGLIIGFNLFLDGCILPAIKNGYSSKPFAEMISGKYNLKNNTYVMNNLLEYANPYGLNFYLGNNLRNFEKEQPENGYFIAPELSIDKIKKKYAEYEFTLLEKRDKFTDYKTPVALYEIRKKQ